MIAPQPHEAPASEASPDVVQPMAVSLAGAEASPGLSLAGPEAATGPGGYRLSGLRPGRPYRLSPPEDRDETMREVRAYFGHEDFWEPV